MTAKTLADLRTEFPPEQVGKLPRAGVTLDYVGHGAVTMRLLDVDPAWNWEPVATDDGRPAFERNQDAKPCGLWIKLTVLGVTRLGYGSCPPGQFEAEKVLIGDAIRNAAMRFGVALDLWVKGHAEDDEKAFAGKQAEYQPSPSRSGPPVCAICEKKIEGKAKKVGAGWIHEGCDEPEGDPEERPF